MCVLCACVCVCVYVVCRVCGIYVLLCFCRALQTENELLQNENRKLKEQNTANIEVCIWCVHSVVTSFLYCMYSILYVYKFSWDVYFVNAPYLRIFTILFSQSPCVLKYFAKSSFPAHLPNL